MTGSHACCPACGHHDLDPRKILIGLPYQGQVMPSTALEYREIITLRCQACGWIGEQSRREG